MTIKKIAVFTSIRSEYGLLSPLLHKLKEHPFFELKLLVGGAHLVKEYGHTVSFIEKDNFDIAQKFPFLFADEEKDMLTRSISALQLQIGKYFAENSFDLLVVLGDRFELLPVVLSATLYKIPIAHISGGDTTEGAIDNQIRHALTKLSHIHFPATELYAKNILSMGEESWRVCISGEPGLDLVKTTQFVDRTVLYNELGLDHTLPVVLITFHPETISNKISPLLIKSVCGLLLEKGYQVLATASNFDEGGAAINNVYESLAAENESFIYHKSLGQVRFYSMLNYADLMIGNSSSGLVEAQSFNLPVLNVGDRQKGRLANPNVIDVPAIDIEIEKKIKEAISNTFNNKFINKENIYGDGNACDRIIVFLEKLEWKKLLSKKDCFNVE